MSFEYLRTKLCFVVVVVNVKILQQLQLKVKQKSHAAANYRSNHKYIDWGGMKKEKKKRRRQAGDGTTKSINKVITRALEQRQQIPLLSCDGDRKAEEEEEEAGGK